MKRRELWAWPAAVVLAAQAGCAVVYQPAGIVDYNGYSSTDVDATTVDVRFSFGRGTSQSRLVRDMALYRCAEITKERGFQGFVVLGTRETSSSGGMYPFAEAAFRIRMFKGSVADVRQALQGMQAEAYEAAEVLQRLEGIVKR